MTFLFFGWVFGAPILAGMIAWFSRSLRVRWIMAANAIVPLVGYAAPLWTKRYFSSIGCGGGVIWGIECPEWAVIVKIAVLHDVLFFYSLLYVIGVFPFILLPTLIVLALTPDRWRR
ncbi:hypothetical protein GIY56_11070 [Paracoccus sp. YIM 132242]|uniref:Uncharacterized protein n=1 Tax=Paracoccus lichenicola TaxID=2665644 RepID=A0A6L6HRH0_9RHOB|nr:hypothetical protein [Paracoccus lichenicola]MTE00833.1 hypothetical protein [Paracoccus lichenicola]